MSSSGGFARKQSFAPGKPARWLPRLHAFLVPWLLFAPPSQAGDLFQAVPRTSRQAVVVSTASWTSARAALQRYERPQPGAEWVPVGKAMPALTGENGLAWGRGLHPIPRGAPRIKREGDRRAPAGVFRITGAFGQLPPEKLGALRIPYRRAGTGWVAVDDPASRHYNQIVDRSKIGRPDWRSAEPLAEGRHYRLAIDLAHNPRNVPGAGSCIFLHEWIGDRRGTAGCTVLRGPDLLTLVRWLDVKTGPVLVQQPE